MSAGNKNQCLNLNIKINVKIDLMSADDENQS